MAEQNPCPSCVEFHVDNPATPIQEGTVRDEASGALLCAECFDFYYTDDFDRHIAGDR